MFLRQCHVPEGTYTLDYVVHDALTGRIGAARTEPFVIPGGSEGLAAVGSLILVQRTERLSEKERAASNPLAWGDLLLYPNLGETVHKAAAKTISFFVPIVARSGPALSATLELLKDGQAAGITPLDVPAPDATGALAVMSQLPTDGFPPGRYTLRITVRHGAAVSAVREASFTLAE